MIEVPIVVVKCICGTELRESNIRKVKPYHDIERLICWNCSRIVGSRKVPYIPDRVKK